MRKLKLQMQITLDGYVAGPNGELDWITFEHDKKRGELVDQIADTSDILLLGQKMTDDFVNYWTSVLDTPESPEYPFAKKMVDIPKIVFSKTLKESRWTNATVESDLVSTVNRLKSETGRDILVYGGAGFVSSLIKEDLIDDYYLFLNPTAIGKGLEIFGIGRKVLQLVDCTDFGDGVVVNHYQRP